MANKTLKFYGNGYDHTGNAAVIVTFNGNTVYTGEIHTLDLDLFLPAPDEQQEIFSFEVDESTYGTFPMTIEVTAGEFVVSAFSKSSGAGNPPNPAQDYNLTDLLFNDNRTNVTIDGVAQSKGPMGDILTGPWYYEIANGSILSADVLIESWGNLFPGNVTP